MNNRETGKIQEERACGYLTAKGYEILERNFYSRFGEVDIIAKQGGTFVFVEVKYRSSTRIAAPEEAVGFKKRRRIIKTADYYRLKHRIPDDIPCRFDVLSITEVGVTHHENAFGYDGKNLS